MCSLIHQTKKLWIMHTELLAVLLVLVVCTSEKKTTKSPFPHTHVKLGLMSDGSSITF